MTWEVEVFRVKTKAVNRGILAARERMAGLGDTGSLHSDPT